MLWIYTDTIDDNAYDLRSFNRQPFYLVGNNARAAQQPYHKFIKSKSKYLFDCC